MAVGSISFHFTSRLTEGHTEIVCKNMKQCLLTFTKYSNLIYVYCFVSKTADNYCNDKHTHVSFLPTGKLFWVCFLLLQV